METQLQSSPPLGRLQSWNAWVTEGKPLLLAALGGIYVAGYMAWAAVAWEFSLGVLPVLDFQYFVAGLVLLSPLILVWVAFFIVRGGLRRWVIWESKVESRRKRTDAALGRIFISVSCVVGFTLLAGKLGFLSLNGLKPYLIFSPVILALVTVALNAVRPNIGPNPGNIPSGGHDESGTGRTSDFCDRISNALGSVGMFLFWLADILFGLGVALFLILLPLVGLKFLPRLPQELGGAKPRCLVLDVELKRLSPELAADLFETPAPPVASEVRRTRKLDVHFSNNQSILIGLPANQQTHRRMVELKCDAIVATTSCAK